MVAQPGSVSAQGVFAAAALAAAASRQLLGELQATAPHVRPGDPCCTRHAEEDPRVERERGYTHIHAYTNTHTHIMCRKNYVLVHLGAIWQSENPLAHVSVMISPKISVRESKSWCLSHSSVVPKPKCLSCQAANGAIS